MDDYKNLYIKQTEEILLLQDSRNPTYDGSLEVYKSLNANLKREMDIQAKYMHEQSLQMSQLQQKAFSINESK